MHYHRRKISTNLGGAITIGVIRGQNYLNICLNSSLTCNRKPISTTVGEYIVLNFRDLRE